MISSIEGILIETRLSFTTQFQAAICNLQQNAAMLQGKGYENSNYGPIFWDRENYLLLALPSANRKFSVDFLKYKCCALGTTILGWSEWQEKFKEILESKICILHRFRRKRSLSCSHHKLSVGNNAYLFIHMKKKKNFMAPFYGWGSTASRLVSFRGGCLLFTTKFPNISGTHFIDLGRMKGWVDLGAKQWFWTRNPWIGNPAP